MSSGEFLFMSSGEFLTAVVNTINRKGLVSRQELLPAFVHWTNRCDLHIF